MQINLNKNKTLVEYDETDRIQNLGKLELKLSSRPYKSLGFEFPIDIALKLLKEKHGHTDT